jgi:hypothetical protein
MGDLNVEQNDTKFESLYEEVFKLENEDKIISNPYRPTAKQNKKARGSLPKIYPKKQGKEPEDVE